jgi:hypothetical protein
MVALAGCGHQASGRAHLAAYVRQVSVIEAKLSAPVSAVTRTGGQFAAAGSRRAAAGAAAGAQVRTLTGAQAEIERQGERLRTLSAPPAAQRLRSLLLRLTASEVALTHQLALMIAFMPRFTAGLTPLGSAATRLAAVLAQRQAYGTAAVAALFAAKATALRRFEATTRRIAARLRRLPAPAVLAPQVKAQLASLNGMGASAGRLADALVTGAPTNVTPLLAAFDRAAAATRTPAARRAQTVATRAYSARITRLAALAQAIAQERLRLADAVR